MVKRHELTTYWPAMTIDKPQTRCVLYLANACDGCVCFPGRGVHQLALVDGRGETQFVVVTARQGEL